jgi:hypothetical protein
MWRRTYERYLERYWELDEECNDEMAFMMGRLGALGNPITAEAFYQLEAGGFTPKVRH